MPEKPKPPPPPRPVDGGGSEEARFHDTEQPWAPGGAGSASDLAAQAEMDRQADPGSGTAPVSNDSADELGGTGAGQDGAAETAAQSNTSTGEPQGMDAGQQAQGSQTVFDSSADVPAPPDSWPEDPGFELDWAGGRS
jgi:hypothetical protein